MGMNGKLLFWYLYWHNDAPCANRLFLTESVKISRILFFFAELFLLAQDGLVRQ
jgi:hypothetical protein